MSRPIVQFLIVGSGRSAVVIAKLVFGRVCRVLVVLVIVFQTLAPAKEASAQDLPETIADDFEQSFLNREVWNPRQISPERYRIDRTVVRSGRGALAISVKASDTGCSGRCQRNEIRIANNLRLKFGQGAWYGFSFQLSGDIPARTVPRWVMGQWKEESDGSPFLAQRYTGGIFHITVQDNDCRVLVASSGSSVQTFYEVLKSGNLGDLPFVTDPADYACEHGIEVEYGDAPVLPDPYGAWVDMVYFVKGGRDGSGVIEIWANGRFVARARGAIGNDRVFGPTQYFKIGIYRNPMRSEATLHFDNFRRGGSRTDVDPSIGATQ